MGYEQSENIQTVVFNDFSAGWYPGKNHNEIPGSLTNPNQPVGALEADHVWWHLGDLTKVYGTQKLTVSALNGPVTGMAEFRDQNTLIGVAGAKVYKDLHSTAVDITGTLTITSGNQAFFDLYRSGSNVYMLGTQYPNAPFKWNGTGNASALGGSPPSAKFVKYWQNHVWLANWPGNEEAIQLSGLRDYESYATLDRYRTDDAITGLEYLDTMLVIFKRDSIGIISGYTKASFQKIDVYIPNSGCVAPQSVSKGRLSIGGQMRNVIFYLADDGFYAFDGSRVPIKISNSIERKFNDSTSTNKFNEARLDKAVGIYVPDINTYQSGISDSGDTTNDLHLIVDTAREIILPEIDRRVAYPFWPSDNVEINAFALMRNSSNNDDVYFGDTAGDIYKISRTLYTENGSTFTSNFKSKIFDAEYTWIVQEINLFMEEVGDYDITFYINSDLSIGDGTSGTASMLDSTVGLGTFVLGTNTLSGKDFLFLFVGIDESGRFLQWKIEQNQDVNFNLKKAELILRLIGKVPNAA